MSPNVIRKKLNEKEKYAVVLYILGSVLSIILGGISFFYLHSFPFYAKIRIFYILWMLVGFASLLGIDFFFTHQNLESIKILFYISLLSFALGSGYFLSSILLFISTYFLFEEYMKREIRRNIKSVKRKRKSKK